MDGESHQLASAMLVLLFAAVMLVTGLLYIDRSGKRFDAPIRVNSFLVRADDGFLRVPAVGSRLGAPGS